MSPLGSPPCVDQPCVDQQSNQLSWSIAHRRTSSIESNFLSTTILVHLGGELIPDPTAPTNLSKSEM